MAYNKYKNTTQVDLTTTSFVFFVMFILGGSIGMVSMPDFPGRFFITGLLFAIFSTYSGIYLNSVVFKDKYEEK